LKKGENALDKGVYINSLQIAMKAGLEIIDKALLAEQKLATLCAKAASLQTSVANPPEAAPLDECKPNAFCVAVENGLIEISRPLVQRWNWHHFKGIGYARAKDEYGRTPLEHLH